MENHPIPQDITGFQFKLIGEMTVKQFAYLATGAVFGWLFIFMLPLPGFLKIPFGLIFAGVGVALAFLPFEGRPLDIMLFNFMMTLFRPNQYVYLKQNTKLLNIYKDFAVHVKKSEGVKKIAPKYSQDQLETYLHAMPVSPRTRYDQKEQQDLQKLATMVNAPTAAQPMAAKVVAPPPTQVVAPVVKPQQPIIQQPKVAPEEPKSEAKPVLAPHEVDAKLQNNINQLLTTEPKIEPTVVESMSNPGQALQKQLELAKAEEASEKNAELAKTAHTKVAELEKLLNDSAAQKQQLEQELVALKKQLTTGKQEVFAPSLAKEVEQPKQTANVKILPKANLKAAGLPAAPEEPNVITGIVKDPRGNPLPNILIEVQDHDGNPVRAFKTTPLGTFASATPLQNGTYTIGFEDTANTNKFDTIQIKATGEVILPIEVNSVDAREELRKQLFGTQQSSAS